jgi:hypothetical protein
MSVGFDCNCKLSYELAKKFKDDGYEFCMRYVGRLKQSTTLDIDKTELDNILKAGLQIGVVQHCPPKPGISPSKDLGTEYGKNAAKFAKEAGYREGCIIYLDLEDVNVEYEKRQQDIFDFCNYWYSQVLGAGYTPGVYIGFNNFMSSEQLYYKLRFQHYWKSFSSVPDVYKRGYEMYQREYKTVNGIQIDTDEVTGDKLGNYPIFMKAEKVLLQTIKLFNDGTYQIE